MRFHNLLVLALGILAGCAPDKKPDAPKPSKRADALDLILLGDKPRRVEVRVEIAGKSVPAIWDDTFAKLHAYFDRDDNGSLDKVEAARLPSPFALRQVLWGQFSPFLGAALPLADLDLDDDDKVSKEELADYYRRGGLGGVIVGVGKAPSTDKLTDALLKRLDTNKDGKVVEAEWKAAAKVLLELDRNDDQLVGPGELVAKLAYPGALGSMLLSAPTPTTKPDPTADGVPLMTLPLRTDDTHWQTALAARRKKEKKPAADVSTLRQDKPAVAWSVKFIEKKTAARQVHSLDGVRLVMRIDTGRLAELTVEARKRLTGSFAVCDANSDRVLDGKELDAPKAILFKQSLSVSDRDSDGKLTEKEFVAWFDLQERVAKGHILLTVIDHGSGLFEFLDADHDGSLSVRELRMAWDRLKAAECVTEKGFDRARLPQHLLAALSQGHPLTPLGKAIRTGPEWFLAMDRNGDGEVSAKEWVGELDLFRKLDRDADGLLDPKEAEKAARKR